jgi:hypothetical protein
MAPMMTTPMMAFPVVSHEFDLGIILAVDEVRLRFVEFVEDSAAGSGNARDCPARSDRGAYRGRSGDAQHSGKEKSPIHDLLLSRIPSAHEH